LLHIATIIALAAATALSDDEDDRYPAGYPIAPRLPLLSRSMQAIAMRFGSFRTMPFGHKSPRSWPNVAAAWRKSPVAEGRDGWMMLDVDHSRSRIISDWLILFQKPSSILSSVRVICSCI